MKMPSVYVKRFAKGVATWPITVQLILLALVTLSAVGFEIPILRAGVGFVYLTFVPGYLIVRATKLQVEPVETLLYSAGLSLTFLMLLGFVVNSVFPLAGIGKPLSLVPLFTSMVCITLPLSVILYKRDDSRNNVTGGIVVANLWAFCKAELAQISFILLLPLLAVLGCAAESYWGYNFVLLMCYGLIGLSPFLVVFNKIRSQLYPLLVVSIALSLLLSRTLILRDVLPGDVVVEFYYAQQVLVNGFWDFTRGSNINAMLSVVMLAPIYSQILNIDLTWVFNIVYPLLFSLAPLALYQLYKRQLSATQAFLAAFFFVTFVGFILDIPSLNRQEIAELFLALSVLLLVDNKMKAQHKRALLIVFGFSIVVSHYSLSYLYLFVIVLALLINYFWTSDIGLLRRRVSLPRRSQMSTQSQLKGQREMTKTMHKSHQSKRRLISPSLLSSSYVLIFAVLCFAWYAYLSPNGYTLTSAVLVGKQVATSFTSDFWNLGVRGGQTQQALGIESLRSTDPAWRATVIVQYVLLFLSAAGLLKMLSNRRKNKFDPLFSALVLSSFVIFAVTTAIPIFSASFSATRVWQILLVLLAPLCVTGGIFVFETLLRASRSTKAQNALKVRNLATVLVACVLVANLLLASGFVMAVTGAEPSNMSLALNSRDWNAFTVQDSTARGWMALNGRGDFKVYGDDHTMLYRDLGPQAVTPYITDTSVHPDWFVFVRAWNTNHNEVEQTWSVQGVSATIGSTVSKTVPLQGDPIFSDAVRNRSLVYNNGLSKIYAPSAMY